MPVVIKPVMNLNDFGVPSNGSNVSAQINSAIAQMSAAGGGMLQGPGVGRSYGIDQGGADIWGGSYGILLQPGVSLDFLGATLQLKAQTHVITTSDNPWTHTVAHITGVVARGATSFQVGSTTGFSQSAWQKVLFRGADSPIDSAETTCCVMAYAKANGSSTIHLDRPINTAFDPATVHGSDNAQIVLLDKPLEGVSIGGFKLVNDMTGGANALACLGLKYAQNIDVHDIDGLNPGPGLVVAQFCDGVTIRNARVRGSKSQSGQLWDGRGFTIAQCSNMTLRNAVIENFENAAVWSEFYSKAVKLEGITINNTFAGRDNQHNALFFTGIGTEVAADNVLLRGYGSYPIDDNGGQGSFTRNSDSWIVDTATDWAP